MPVKDASLEDLLHAAARRWARRPALRFLERVDTAEHVSELDFATFVARIFETADRFRALGVSEDRPAALIVPNTPEGQIALWGAEIAGAAMPINPLLPDHHVSELIQRSGASVLVVADQDMAVIARDAFGTIVERILPLSEVAAAGSGARPADRAGVATDRDRIVAYFHTGGTTGSPKLARHRERNQLAAALGFGRCVELDMYDVILNPLPLFHVAGALCVGLASILAGACQILPTRAGARAPGFREHFWSMIEQQQVTMIAGVPTIIGAAMADLPEKISPSVRAILVGGAPMPLSLERDITERVALPVRAVYGMTEAAGLITARRAGQPVPPGWAGPAAPGVEVRTVADTDRPDRPCPPGVRGNIIVKGETIGPGYVDAAQNQALFTSDGWLITGDLGTLDPDGNLRIEGRAKDVIIRGGHNIEALLIEEACLALDGVEAAAAVAAPDAYAGELPYLYVQPKPGISLDEATLLMSLRDRLEGPAVPKHVGIVDRLPLTGAGKAYKPALRAMAVEHVLEPLFDAVGIVRARWSVADEEGTLRIYASAAVVEQANSILETLMLDRARVV